MLGFCEHYVKRIFPHIYILPLHMEGNVNSGVAEVSTPQSIGGENMPNNSFSSKGLADFKPGIDHTKPMVDIHHGKEDRGIFKSPSEFHTQKSIIDISKPFVADDVKPFEKSSEPQQKNDPMVRIPHQQNPSIFKDIHSFEKKGLIDISKSYEKEWVVSHKNDFNEQKNDGWVPKNDFGKKENKAPEASHNMTLQSNEEFKTPEYNNHQVQLEKENVVDQKENQNYSFNVEQNTTSPKLKNNLPTFQENPKPEEIPLVKTDPEVKTDTEQLTKTEKLVKEQILEKSATQQQLSALQKESVEYAPELATTEKISLKKAREAMEEIVVSAKVFQNTKEAPITKSEKKVSKKLSLEKKAKALFLKRKAEKMEFKKEKDEEGILFFEKDKRVNVFRQMAARLSYEKLSSQGKNVTGSMIAQEVSAQILQGKKSGIVDGVQDDRSADDVVSSLSKVGTIENSISLSNVMKDITNHETAVKLVKESSDGALKENAEKVYGTAELHGVGAKYEEEHSYGKIQELENGQVVYITQRKAFSPVIDGEMPSE